MEMAKDGLEWLQGGFSVICEISKEAGFQTNDFPRQLFANRQYSRQKNALWNLEGTIYKSAVGIRDKTTPHGTLKKLFFNKQSFKCE